MYVRHTELKSIPTAEMNSIAEVWDEKLTSSPARERGQSEKLYAEAIYLIEKVN